ncbi:MAG TPA: hypothetical protein VGL08_01735 [Paraburkholderia sp.]|jgi:hypothetical protein
MKVVHLSNTPVAGSPGNIVSALNRLTEVRARHIVFNAAAYRTRTFAIDIDWKTQQPQALDVIADADVVHIHQFFSLDDTFGAGFQQRFGAKKIIRQYHSAPDLWAKGDAALIERIVRDEVAQLVIAQGPERYYPFARVVPNVVPLNDPRYVPHPEAAGLPIVTFSPSGHASAWKRRWETKGVPQTLALLRKLECKGLCRLQLIVDTPHDACLRAKQQAAVAIDECVTGNYHLSGLEALSQGKPTLGHLDNRVQSQLRKLTGASDLPWIDVRLEEAEAPLRALLEDRALRAELGAASRQWMETHYQESAMIEHYRRAYLDLFNAPHRFGMQRFTGDGEPWLAVALPDYRWAARRRANAGWRDKLRSLLKRGTEG